MKPLEVITAALVVIGALNWGLVAIAEFDLVAALLAEGFGTTSALSRVVYGLVGLSAVLHAAALMRGSRTQVRETAHSRA
jgi:uncharacterized protein